MVASERNSLEAPCFANRRGFLKGSVALIAGFSALFRTPLVSEAAAGSESNLQILGPKPGYSPQVGTLVSELTWMRDFNGVIRATEGLTKADLDYLIDANANTIGALMQPFLNLGKVGALEPSRNAGESG